MLMKKRACSSVTSLTCALTTQAKTSRKKVNAARRKAPGRSARPRRTFA